MLLWDRFKDIFWKKDLAVVYEKDKYKWVQNILLGEISIFEHYWKMEWNPRASGSERFIPMNLTYIIIIIVFKVMIFIILNMTKMSPNSRIKVVGYAL